MNWLKKFADDEWLSYQLDQPSTVGPPPMPYDEEAVTPGAESGKAVGRLQSLLYSLGEEGEEASRWISSLFPHAKLLGSGSRGIALDIGNGLVGKLTSQEDEVQVAQKYKGKNVDGIINIHSIAEVIPQRLWMIISDRVQELDKSEQNDINSYFEGTKSGIMEEFDSSALTPPQPGITPDIYQEWYELVTQKLPAAGQNPGDARGPNLGRDDQGNLVLLDIGVHKRSGISANLNKNWLQKLAGPIKVTPEISDFANRVVGIIVKRTKEDGSVLDYGDSILNEYIETPYGEVEVNVVLQKPENKHKIENIQGNAETPAWWARNNPHEQGVLAGSHINLYYDLPTKVYSGDIREVVLHELIHSIDPKLNKDELFDTPWHKKQRNNMRRPDYTGSPEYHSAPWEQDAFISSRIYEMVNMWKRNGVSYERAKESLKMHPPERPFEFTYYKTPKLWQRYLKHLYQVVEETYADEFAVA